MAKARIGHFVEAQVLQSLGVDYIDESEVLTPADYANHIDKWQFTVPFVCGATNLGEALRRITEGAAMIRSKGEAGTGDVSNATTHMRSIRGEIRRLQTLPEDELFVAAKELQAPYELVQRGRPGRQAAGRAVHRRRHRHPGRRGDDDAARRRGRLRRLGHLQVGQPGAAGRGDRQGDHVLRRPRRHRQGVARPRRGDGRHQRRGRSRSRTGWPSAAGERAAERASDRGARAAGRRPRAPARLCRGAGPRRSPCAGPAELDAVDGLVLPGGESTTIVKLARTFDLLEPLRKRIADGLPTYGSCAGMILLADRIDGGGSPLEETIGGLDITVRRNAFGRQVDSFEAGRRRRRRRRAVRCTRSSSGRRGSRRSGRRRRPLGRVSGGAAAGRIVAVRQQHLLATSFHPELTGDGRIHGYFCDMVRTST